MMTVKQVSELTGISVRTLHYYDEIGLFKPSDVTESGYRLYNDDALEILQQILFFKEMDFPLKDIKAIMLSPKYDKSKAFENQRKLIQAKCDRLNGLLSLLDKLIKGERYMSFKEFDMSEYFDTLKEFRKMHVDEIIQFWGSVDEFDRITDDIKSKEQVIAEAAIKQYGSIEKYVEAMKKNLSNFPKTIETLDAMKGNVDSYTDKSAELMAQLTSDLSKDVSSKEIQQIVDDLVNMGSEHTQGMDMGDGYWNLMADGYLANSAIIEVTDKRYGKGASAFIGEALKAYHKGEIT